MFKLESYSLTIDGVIQPIDTAQHTLNLLKSPNPASQSFPGLSREKSARLLTVLFPQIEKKYPEGNMTVEYHEVDSDNAEIIRDTTKTVKVKNFMATVKAIQDAYEAKEVLKRNLKVEVITNKEDSPRGRKVSGDYELTIA